MQKFCRIYALLRISVKPKILFAYLRHTYIHTKLYLNHASLNSRWKAGFHEGREITYLQEINYLQEIQKYNKKNPTKKPPA